MKPSRLFALILPALLLPAAAWGRDDLCVFRKGLFLCDTAHDGGTAEVRFRFGKAGDIPFLIRLSSDGRADPCLYAHGRLVCGIFPVTGGKPTRTLEIRFGVEGDIPVLGDVDGK
jgi:hypothetical protein